MNRHIAIFFLKRRLAAARRTLALAQATQFDARAAEERAVNRIGQLQSRLFALTHRLNLVRHLPKREAA